MALSFGANASVYDRLRPGYPAAALDWALDGAAAGAVLDLGAGTGRLTAELAGRGLDVVAVEPDPQMRAVLAARLPAVTVSSGFAEDLPLADGSLDAVFVGQAFHWFRRPDADYEIARVLRPGGLVAVLTNVNPACADFEAVLHQRVLGVSQPSLARGGLGLASDAFAPSRETLVDNPQRLSRADFLRLPSTWSWVATAAPDARARLAVEASRLADEIASPDGYVTMPYATRVVTSRVSAGYRGGRAGAPPTR